MSKDKTNLKTRLKPYHIILLSCILSYFLILNSNHVNNQRKEAHLNKEKNELFTKIIKGRMLSSQENSATEEICSRASDDLNEYYKTGDLSKIDLDDDAIECEDKDKSYMKALIEVVRSLIDGDDNSNDDDNGDGDDGTLRNLKEIDKDNLIEYLMRVLPFIIFLAFGILAIFGWIVCCFCCCCDCCCCCCCKKEGCKIPCFIFTYVFYALVIAVSFYGLTQASKIFEGLSNTQCSLLKFFEQVLNGEIKTERPRWAGINGINTLLDRLIEEIRDIEAHTGTSLSDGISDISTKKENFQTEMEDAGKSFFESDGTTYKAKYLKNYNTYSDYSFKDEYVLDIVMRFGKKESSGYTSESFLYGWNEEFSTVAQNADNYLNTANEGFSDILGTSFDSVIDGLNKGRDNLDKLTKPFTNAENKISDILSKFSEEVDKYGKMSVNIVFGVLMGMNVALAVLVLLIYCCSTKSFTNCCCCRCLFKSCTHVLWNILALMMILAFIIGSVLGLVGNIGGDMMSLVSFIMSKENFDNTDNPLLLNKLKDAKKYIKRCIHDDGDISQELNLNNALNSFNDINRVENDITEAKNTFDSLKEQCRTFNTIKQLLEEERDYKRDTSLFPVRGVDSDRMLIGYNSFLTKINEFALDSSNIRWSNESTNGNQCTVALEDENSYYHPKYCKPKHFKDSQNDYFKVYADILNDIDGMVEYANDDDEAKTDSVINVIKKLKGKYETFLGGYSRVLGTFERTIHRITDLVRQYSSDDNAFSFLNGKFIGINLKIVLKYLKYSLGKDLYTVGICLVVVGFSLILSVSCTIFLIVYINIELKKNMIAANNPIPNVMTVSPYQPGAPVVSVAPNINY